MGISYTTTRISPKYHDAIINWQKKNFPELGLLLKYWDKYFPGLPTFELVAKVGELRSPTIEVGKYAGHEKLEEARSMAGNMFYTARRVIRAQCSTEFGSIEQHRMSLDTAPNDEARFDILRIMAEELRHAYQMFWVLDHDPTWKKPGHGDVAAETIEELLSMRMGSHVLDAFNIEFRDFLDNTIYTAVIDLVGKYQLDMQQVFSYAPMARSMRPMLQEEGFHMGFGRRFLKELAVQATQGTGSYSINDIQRALNKWYPRGLEMFGNEQGGETMVIFGFKTKTNGQAQADYIAEVQGIVEGTNVAIVRTHHPNMPPDEARRLVRDILLSGEVKKGIRPEDLLYLPDRKFFRRRGPAEIALKPYDIRGTLLTEEDRPLSPEGYVRYLTTVLPESYFHSSDFQNYLALLKEHYERPAPEAYFG